MERASDNDTTLMVHLWHHMPRKVLSQLNSKIKPYPTTPFRPYHLFEDSGLKCNLHDKNVYLLPDASVSSNKLYY